VLPKTDRDPYVICYSDFTEKGNGVGKPNTLQVDMIIGVHGHEDDEHHVATCFLFESTESVENVSVGFMAALHFAQLGNKVTLICEKQKVEKDFEATLSYLSRPRCVQALRNILFL